MSSATASLFATQPDPITLRMTPADLALALQTARARLLSSMTKDLNAANARERNQTRRRTA